MTSPAAISLKKSFLVNIEAVVGARGMSSANTDRLSYSRDSSFRSTIQAHYGHFENFPDLIVWPQNIEQVARLIKTARDYKVAVVPYGGGSGVCGGALNAGGMTIDLKAMNRVLRIDSERLFVEAEPGILGKNLEDHLNRNGFTMGHFPSSILSASLGGYLAARSAGQLSSKYGKIEDMVIDLQFVDGLGRVHQTSDVTRGRGIDITQAIVGSEGTLGIITKARLKIYPLPEGRLFRSYSFKNMEYGLEAMRRIMQTGISPDVLRLYNEIDTIMVLAKSDSVLAKTEDEPTGDKPFALELLDGVKAGAMKLLFHGHRAIQEASRLSWLGCALVVMLEGHERLIAESLKIIDNICSDLNATDLGEKTAIHWHEHRYSVSYKASKLFSEGAFTDTMEVATTWDNITNLYNGVVAALKSSCLVLAHVSHVYNEGAAIYFTIVAPLTGLKSTLSRYDKIWDTAMTAVERHGGILSHHHGIGRLKKKFIAAEWGEATQIYTRLKDLFDPSGILNPGVLQ